VRLSPVEYCNRSNLKVRSSINNQGSKTLQHKIYNNGFIVKPINDRIVAKAKNKKLAIIVIIETGFGVVQNS
jgi:hypothetical protein